LKQVPVGLLLRRDVGRTPQQAGALSFGGQIPVSCGTTVIIDLEIDVVEEGAINDAIVLGRQVADQRRGRKDTQMQQCAGVQLLHGAKNGVDESLL